MSTKPPVAIRITRPYQTEEEFFAHELETISRTGVTLVGAQPRPEGVVLRFELALASGGALLRGEGRVIGFKAIAFGSEPGLSLRFTRLDSKSKALVDRVGAMRETKRSIPPPPMSRPKEVVPPPVPIAAASSADAIPISVEVHEAPTATHANVPDEERPSLAKPIERENTLSRLRQRAAAIRADDIDRILADGAARRRRG